MASATGQFALGGGQPLVPRKPEVSIPAPETMMRIKMLQNLMRNGAFAHSTRLTGIRCAHRRSSLVPMYLFRLGVAVHFLQTLGKRVLHLFVDLLVVEIREEFLDGWRLGLHAVLGDLDVRDPDDR